MPVAKYKIKIQSFSHRSLNISVFYSDAELKVDVSAV